MPLDNGTQVERFLTEAERITLAPHIQRVAHLDAERDKAINDLRTALGVVEPRALEDWLFDGEVGFFYSHAPMPHRDWTPSDIDETLAGPLFGDEGENG